MQHAYNFLLTVPPASIEPERAFSSAGILCSKLRSRMSDHVAYWTICYFCVLTFRRTSNPLDLSRSIISMVYVADVPIGQWPI